MSAPMTSDAWARAAIELALDVGERRIGVRIDLLAGMYRQQLHEMPMMNIYMLH